ncbi:MAG: hypothetical protein AAGH15_11110 [Myxococcota bacterium]
MRLNLVAVLLLFACSETGVVPLGGTGDAGADLDTMEAGLPRDAAAPDEGGVDGGADPDAGLDLGGLSCLEAGFGVPCTEAMGCRIGFCQPPLAPVPPDVRTQFPGGFCTLGGATIDTEPDCLGAPEVCGACMTCAPVPGLADEGACFLDCDPEAPGNGICRDGWRCAPLTAGGGVCVTGCQTDLDCISAGARPVCNPETFRCERDGDPDSRTGDPCRGDVECEPGGRCQRETDAFDLPDGEVILWEDGYCFGPPCASDDECAGASICGGGRSEVWTRFVDTCLVGCDLSVGVDPAAPTTWRAGRGGCDEGFLCLSNGDAGSPEVGICFPDRVDPLSPNGIFVQPFGSGPVAPNIGAPCTEHDECFNPFGFGRCLVGFNGRDGYCTVDDALLLEAAGFDVCGGGAEDGSLPVEVTAPPAAESQCLRTCESGDECPAGFGCVPSDDGSVCSPSGCTSDAECRTGDECILSVCFDTCARGDACDDGLGCVPLDAIFSVDETATVCFDVCQNDDQCPGDQVCAGATAETLGACSPLPDERPDRRAARGRSASRYSAG